MRKKITHMSLILALLAPLSMLSQFDGGPGDHPHDSLFVDGGQNGPLPDTIYIDIDPEDLNNNGFPDWLEDNFDGNVWSDNDADSSSFDFGNDADSLFVDFPEDSIFHHHHDSIWGGPIDSLDWDYQGNDYDSIDWNNPLDTIYWGDSADTLQWDGGFDPIDSLVFDHPHDSLYWNGNGDTPDTLHFDFPGDSIDWGGGVDPLDSVFIDTPADSIDWDWTTDSLFWDIDGDTIFHPHQPDSTWVGFHEHLHESMDSIPFALGSWEGHHPCQADADSLGEYHHSEDELHTHRMLQASDVFMNIESVYPNPTTDYLNLGLNAANDETIIVNVLTMDGRFVNSMKISLAKGYSQIQLDVTGYPNGTYFIQCVNGNGRTSSVFVKE